jgi:hypothetical protein
VGAQLQNGGRIVARRVEVAGQAQYGRYRLTDGAVFEGRFTAGVEGPTVVFVGDGTTSVVLHRRSSLSGFFPGSQIEIRNAFTWFWRGSISTTDAAGARLIVRPNSVAALYFVVPQSPQVIENFGIESTGILSFDTNQPLVIGGSVTSLDSTSIKIFHQDTVRAPRVSAEELTLAGTLSVYAGTGFDPHIGARFTLMSAPTRIGTFSQTRFPPLPPGRAWEISYPPGEVVLTVVGTTAREADPGPALLLEGPFPNPADASGAAVRISVRQRTSARLTLHDLLGREVAVLFNGQLEAGATNVVIPSQVAAAQYLLRSEANGEVVIRTMTILP